MLSDGANRIVGHLDLIVVGVLNPQDAGAWSLPHFTQLKGLYPTLSQLQRRHLPVGVHSCRQNLRVYGQLVITDPQLLQSDRTRILRFLLILGAK